jgi:signal transduction histidine kinase
MASLMATIWFWREAEQLDQAKFSAAVTGMVEQLDTQTERYAEQLERLGDLAESRQDISAADWKELVKKLEPMSNLPAFLELAYATNPMMPSRKAVEELERTEHRTTYMERSCRLSPELKVAQTWLNGTSLTPDDTQFWLDTKPVHECWLTAVNGRLRSSPRRLIPQNQGQPTTAVTLFAPVFANDFLELNTLSPEFSRQLRDYRFKGLVIGTINWKLFLETALPSANDQVTFDAFADAASPAQVSANTWMGGVSDECRVLAHGFSPRFQTTQKWPFFRSTWQLVFYSTQQFDQNSTRYRAWVALAGGVLLSSVMAAAMAVQLRARLRQEVVSQQLRSTLNELEATRRERERLNLDLHDGTIQSLYALQLGLSHAADQAMESSPPLGARLTDYRRNLTAIIGQLRGYILRHEADDSPKSDLAGLLIALVERMRCTTETELFTEVSQEAANSLTGEQAVHWANLAHEALSNALRHSQARRITMALRHAPGRVILEICDDGRGFDPTAPPRTGIGLQSMKMRAANTGGTFELESLVGIGTRVSVSVAVADNPRSEQET